MSEQVVDLGYIPRKWQAFCHANRTRFFVLVLHRRAGKTVFLCLEAINAALRVDKKNPVIALIYPQREQGKRVAWPILKEYCEKIPAVEIRESDLIIVFPNGARIELYGTHDNQAEYMRGHYFDLALIDEYAQCDPRAMATIIRPALADRKGELIVCGTPRGQDHFYQIWKDAGDTKRENWSRYILKASESNIIDAEELADAKQSMDTGEYASEFECSFEAAVKGAYYGTELTAAREDDRITNIPYTAYAPTACAFDVGVADLTVVWFCQITGTSINMIDCLAWSNTSLENILTEIRRLPYNLTFCGLPHDLKQREQTSNIPKYSIFEQMLRDTRIELLPYRNIKDSINFTRSLFSQVRFDKTKCNEGIDYLGRYTRKWNRTTNRFMDIPLHDHASDYADAFTYLLMLLDVLGGGDGNGTGRSIDSNTLRTRPVRIPKVKKAIH